MSLSVLSRIGRHRVVMVVASVGALAVGGALALVGTASASGTPATSASHSCRDATLNGTYTYAYADRWSPAASARRWPPRASTTSTARAPAPE
jgi:hypothetical protein